MTQGMVDREELAACRGRARSGGTESRRHKACSLRRTCGCIDEAHSGPGIKASAHRATQHNRVITRNQRPYKEWARKQQERRGVIHTTKVRMRVAPCRPHATRSQYTHTLTGGQGVQDTNDRATTGGGENGRCWDDKALTTGCRPGSSRRLLIRLTASQLCIHAKRMTAGTLWTVPASCGTWQGHHATGNPSGSAPHSPLTCAWTACGKRPSSAS